MPEIANKTQKQTITLKLVSSGSSVTYRLSEKSQIRQRHVPSYEFMAASVGDMEWLNQSICSKQRENGAAENDITYDANVCTLCSLSVLILNGLSECHISHGTQLCTESQFIG